MEKNLDPSRVSAFSFASRKEPEYMCHRLMQCTICDLVYADQPPGEHELACAYHSANYDSSEEANDAAAAYMRVIQPVMQTLPGRGRALEIGTGTGVFLEHLLQEGFRELVGVEPSSAAIAQAPHYRQAWIREGMFEEKDFTPESFDLICCFMTMEHVREPGAIAEAAFRLLRPGGAFVTVTHDYRSFVNRCLGKRSPIIDIEHLQLFSVRSAQYLFENTGYIDVNVFPLVNTYSAQYWVRLLPLPQQLKRMVRYLLPILGMAKARVGLNVGNFMTTGFKRA